MKSQLTIFGTEERVEPARPYPNMRARCPSCRHPHGEVTLSNGQRVVRCAACGTYCYCAPKDELARRGLA